MSLSVYVKWYKNQFYFPIFNVNVSIGYISPKISLVFIIANELTEITVDEMKEEKKKIRYCKINYTYLDNTPKIANN